MSMATLTPDASSQWTHNKGRLTFLPTQPHSNGPAADAARLLVP